MVDLMNFIERHKSTIGYLIMFAFVLVALYGGHHADQQAQRAIQVNCQFGNKNRDVMRLILKDANNRTQTSKQRTEEQKRIARVFYERQIARLKPFDCEALR